MIGFSLKFSAGPMLIRRQDLGIGLPKVSEAGALLIRCRNLVPQLMAGSLGSGTGHPGHDLPSSAAQSQPNPHLLSLFEHERPNFVQLQHIVGLGGEQSLLQIAHPTSLLLEQPTVFFSRIATTVPRDIFKARAMPRDIFKARAMPRWLIRSFIKART